MSTAVRYLDIDENHAGQRVDNYLMALLHQVPRAYIYRILRKGEVRVNKKRVKPTYRLEVGDQVRVPPVKEAAVAPQVGLTHWQKKLEQAILYEDAQLLIINKPAGLAVHGGTGIRAGLIEQLRLMRPQAKFLELVHRLDRDTSGCLLVAKKRSALLELHRQLREKQLKKCYWAVVSGRWPKALGKVDKPLKKNHLKSGERIVRVDAEGQEAQTTFQVQQFFTDATLLSVWPQTGRTHQIRVHTQCSGHPILGDEKYCVQQKDKDLNQRYQVARLMLHARSVKCWLNGHEITAEAPVDRGWEACLERLSY